MAAKLESLSPLGSIEVRMEKSARERFVEQMRKFGDTFGFRMLIKLTSPDPDDVFFQMWRDDVDLLGGNSSDTAAPDLKFSIGFFPKRGHPVPPPENVAPLMEGLKRFIGEVPGVTFVEQ